MRSPGCRSLPECVLKGLSYCQLPPEGGEGAKIRLIGLALEETVLQFATNMSKKYATQEIPTIFRQKVDNDESVQLQKAHSYADEK